MPTAFSGILPMTLFGSDGAGEAGALYMTVLAASSVPFSGSLNLSLIGGGTGVSGVLPMTVYNNSTGMTGALNLSVYGEGIFDGYFVQTGALNLSIINKQASGWLPMTVYNQQGSSSGTLDMSLDAILGGITGVLPLSIPYSSILSSGSLNLYVGGF